MRPLCGPVAQLGARFNRTEEVAGSNPARSTGFWIADFRLLIEALNQQSTIENLHFGPIAQLGARLNGIEKVAGSNPAGSTQGRHRASVSPCTS